jgi:ribosomal protein S18 acetylase RimI-like enzyme
MEIRDATDADWPAMWRFMAPIVAAGETYAWDLDMTADEARSIWFPAPPGATLVATEGDAILGTAELQPNHGGPGSHVANASFMVDPAQAGRGAGRALGEAVIARAAREGFRAIVFNAVAESNARAVALWRSLGFTVLATIPEGFDHPVHGRVGLHVMHRPLV